MEKDSLRETPTILKLAFFLPRARIGSTVVTGMGMAPMGSYVRIFGSQLVDRLRIKRCDLVTGGGTLAAVKALKVHTRLSVLLCLQLPDQVSALSYCPSAMTAHRPPSSYPVLSTIMFLESLSGTVSKPPIKCFLLYVVVAFTTPREQ